MRPRSNALGGGCRPLLGVLAVLASGISCGDVTGLSLQDLVALELHVRPASSYVMTNDTLWISVVAINRSSRTLDLEPGLCTPLALEILDAAGNRVSSQGFGACGSISGISQTRLAPGDSVAIGTRWRAVANFENLWAAPREPLAPGTYFVVGGLVSSHTARTFAKRSARVPITVDAIGFMQ